MKRLLILPLLLGCACGSGDDEASGTGGATGDGDAATGGTTSGDGGNGGTSGDGDGASGGTPSGEGCDDESVISCSTSSGCSDYYGSGYTEEYVMTICDGVAGVLEVGEPCDRSAWTSGCVQDISEMNRCKIAWREESVEDHESLCAWYVIPAE